MSKSGVYEHQYKLGISQVLLRSDVVAALEARREVCLNGAHNCKKRPSPPLARLYSPFLQAL